MFGAEPPDDKVLLAVQLSSSGLSLCIIMIDTNIAARRPKKKRL
jgi:hypothetical protein